MRKYITNVMTSLIGWDLDQQIDRKWQQRKHPGLVLLALCGGNPLGELIITVSADVLSPNNIMPWAGSKLTCNFFSQSLQQLMILNIYFSWLSFKNNQIHLRALQWFSHPSWPLEWKCHHFDEFFITGNTWSCQNNNILPLTKILPKLK